MSSSISFSNFYRWIQFTNTFVLPNITTQAWSVAHWWDWGLKLWDGFPCNPGPSSAMLGVKSVLTPTNPLGVCNAIIVLILFLTLTVSQRQETYWQGPAQAMCSLRRSHPTSLPSLEGLDNLVPVTGSLSRTFYIRITGTHLISMEPSILEGRVSLIICGTVHTGVGGSGCSVYLGSQTCRKLRW